MSQPQRRALAPAPAARGHAAARSTQDKENDHQGRHHDAPTQAHSGNRDTDVGQRAASKTQSSRGHHSNNNHDKDDEGHQPAFQEEDDEEDGSPIRAARVRRMSAKQMQLVEDSEAAESRKAEKAAKAAKKSKKQQLQASGEDDDEDMEPRQDDLFTSRTVQSRPAATKILAQRNSKVPPPPNFPSDAWRQTGPSQSRAREERGREERHDVRDHRDFESSSASDHDHRARPSPVVFRGRSPTPAARLARPPQVYNINGGRVPDRLDLQLYRYRDHSEDDNSSRTRPPHRTDSTRVDRLFDGYNEDNSGRAHPARPPSPARPSHRHDDDDSSRTRPARPPSPSAGDKRARSPDDSDDLRTVQAQRTTSSTGRPKAKDFDETTRELIALAIILYRCYISSKYAFPDHAKELEFLAKAWAKACRQLNISMELTPTISKLELVDIIYGFKSGQNKKTITYNRQLAESLKENLTFTFKNPEARTGIYKTPLIQRAVNAMWFANRRDEGPSFPEFFNPITKPGVAIVLTVAENLIDERLTGIRTDIPFTTNDYRSVYDSHLQALEEFEEQTHPHKIWKISASACTILAGAFHSGAQPITAAKKSVLEKKDVAAAIREYEEDSETETEGEQGGSDEQ
ncbi:hypothetical protein B0H10DRAFT_2235523 [Mycena sp. CBHHK59/15]|nr:hypothetical protein B0H10DRAFT_2235523 [Mycena sp. CBHHK59/15]